MKALFYFENIAYSLGPEGARRVTVSGSAAEGGVLVVRGPSGAGKSTLLRVLARLQPCADGEAFLNGVSWHKIPGTDWRASVHYLSQKPALFDGTLARNLALPFTTRVLKNKNIINPDAVKTTMQELFLPPDLWEQDARTLSGGEAARVTFVRAILIDPVVMLLDEPTAALDEKSRNAFYRVLSRWLAVPGRSAVLVSHSDGYKLLDRVSFLDIVPEKPL